MKNHRNKNTLRGIKIVRDSVYLTYDKKVVRMDRQSFCDWLWEEKGE